MANQGQVLDFRNHARELAGNRYIYAVVSRRSRGLSIGINLNPDKACNFDCPYCQVDRTTPGALGEIQLTDSLAKLVDDGIPCHGLRFEGRRFDCGHSLGYLKANIVYALERSDLRDDLSEYLIKIVGHGLKI